MKDFVQHKGLIKGYRANIGNDSRHVRLLKPLFSLVLAFAVFALGAGLLLSVSHVKAAGTASTLSQTNVTPPAAQVSQQAAPNAVDTSAPSLPNPVASVGTGGTNSTGTGTNSTPVAVASSTFPWWLPVLAAVVLLLLAVFFLMRNRQRQQIAMAVTPIRSSRPAAVPTATTTTTTTTSSASSVAPFVAAVPASTTAQITCPNCGTLNGPSEKFCHECGQDLRSLQAAPAVVNEPVDEYTPYLETLNRVDEQLEYVLARPRVSIGSAASNDIVIDPSFAANGTVAPVQAELRRQDGIFTLVDMASANTTFVNGGATGEHVLADGDQIKLGDVSFIYHAPARPQ